jgi:hypothetical protein
MAAVNSAKQRHPTVPSSNNPPIPEWAPHYWYILRCAALQAHPDNNDNTAVHLMNFFASMTVVTPCPECREHYVEDWVVEPFTLDHARHTEAAMRWVEDLRLKVEARVKAKLGTVPPVMTHVAAGAAEGSAHVEASVPAVSSASASASASAARSGPKPGLVRPPLSRFSNGSAVRRSNAVTGALGASAASAASAPESIHTAALRKYAIRASLHVTAANQSGRRMGCNCPTKSKSTANSITQSRAAPTSSSYRRRPHF